MEVTNLIDALTEIERLEARVKVLEDALTDATAHLAGASSAYNEFASRHRSVGRAKTDAVFTIRKVDFENAIARARATLKGTGK